MEPPAVDTSSPDSVRNAIRKGFWRGPTSGVCSGYLQAKYEVPKHKDVSFLSVNLIRSYDLLLNVI